MAFLTSLDSPESNLHPQPPSPAAKPPLAEPASVTFRHSGWRHRRDQTREAFLRLGLPEKRIARWDECGIGGWVWQSVENPGQYKVTGTCCHDRWCLPCGATRGRTIARNVHAHVDDKLIRFVTLTLAHRDQPLKQSVKDLQSYFVRLRRTKFWLENVTGGAAFLEVKLAEDGNHWHPHLHMLVETQWLEQSILKAIWHKITGDSWIVDVRPCESKKHLVWYVTKYVSKPLDSTIFTREATIDEAIEAMHGRRTCTTFGAWRGLDLTEPDEESEWISVGPLSELIAQASNGDAGARHVISRLPVDSLSPRRPET